jgi:hypothetical protein
MPNSTVYSTYAPLIEVLTLDSGGCPCRAEATFTLQRDYYYWSLQPDVQQHQLARLALKLVRDAPS